MIPIGEKRLFLLDIDGTICVGNRLIPGADRFLNGLSEYGGDYVFITNNTTMSVADYRKKFAKLGIPTTSGNFLTASVATAHYLKQKYGSRPVYVLGTDSLIRELESFGVCTTCDPEKEGIACVLASYDNELTYQKLTDICRLLTERPELDYAATNPDYVCPIEFGYVFDIIRVVSESGTTVLLVEQNAKKALSIADRAYVLETGKITMSGNASDLLNDEAVQKAYLGE